MYMYICTTIKKFSIFLYAAIVLCVCVCVCITLILIKEYSLSGTNSLPVCVCVLMLITIAYYHCSMCLTIVSIIQYIYVHVPQVLCAGYVCAYDVQVSCMMSWRLPPSIPMTVRWCCTAISANNVTSVIGG